ncbi:hypothetical protein Hypma_010157 [Hypsizygus marmoreus]|uniref:Uncharacterized protein n=1 Tax=Hypsizygus marmoreus TaxID=39966 RepID=A0A369JMR1_HYPMA|nr:hypothetical protein Hypma_010157 [Hypsizygus marmoreus]
MELPFPARRRFPDGDSLGLGARESAAKRADVVTLPEFRRLCAPKKAQERFRMSDINVDELYANPMYLQERSRNIPRASGISEAPSFSGALALIVDPSLTD